MRRQEGMKVSALTCVPRVQNKSISRPTKKTVRLMSFKKCLKKCKIEFTNFFTLKFVENVEKRCILIKHRKTRGRKITNCAVANLGVRSKFMLVIIIVIISAVELFFIIYKCNN